MGIFAKQKRAEEPGVSRCIFNVAYLAGDGQLNNVRRADLKASVTLNPPLTTQLVNANADKPQLLGIISH